MLAVAGGLLLAQLVVPASGPLARRALRSGHVVSALASTQVARRPALRRLIAIITVACALLVFAVDTWEVADRNRTVRAGVENGAPVVLTVDAKDAGALRSAVLGIDPRQSFATPVVTASSAGDGGPRTTAVEPAAFARIARWGSEQARPTRATMHKLDAETVPPLRLTGERVRVRIRASFTGVAPVEGAPPPVLRPLSVGLELLSARDGRSLGIELTGRLRQGSFDYDAAAPCADGCLLRGVEIQREFGDFNGIKLRFAIERLLSGPKGEAATIVDLGPISTATWQPVLNENGDEVTVDPSHPISFTANTFGSFLAVQRGDVPVTSPALVAGDVLDREFGPTFPDPPALAPDLTGIEVRYDVAGHITQVPRTGAKGVLVNLAAIDKTAPPTTQTSYAVWLAADDPRREASTGGRPPAPRHRRHSPGQHPRPRGGAVRRRTDAGPAARAAGRRRVTRAGSVRPRGRRRHLVGVSCARPRRAARRRRAGSGRARRRDPRARHGGGARHRGRCLARPGRRAGRPAAPAAVRPARPSSAGDVRPRVVSGRSGRRELPGPAGPRLRVRRPLPGRVGDAGPTEAGPMRRRMASALVGLRLAVRGLWYRRSTALIVLVLAVVASAAAVVAPLYSRAAEESIVRDTLQRADVFTLGVHISRPQGDRQDPVDEERTAPFAAAQMRHHLIHPAFGAVQVALQTRGLYHPTAGPNRGSDVVGRVVERTDVCAHLPTLTGRCPRQPSEGIVTRRSLAILGVRIGDTLPIDLTELTADELRAVPPTLLIKVVGSFDPVSVENSYWVGQPYFGVLPEARAEGADYRAAGG